MERAASGTGIERLGLVATGIHARRGGREILCGVDLAAAPGELVCVIGPNGSGKTTLIGVLAGSIPSDAGAVHLVDALRRPLSETDAARARRADIRAIEQECHIDPDRSVAEQIAPDRAANGAPRGDRVARLAALLGVSDRLRDRAGRLSAGERRRVAVARGLFDDPALLLADEPTASLDARWAEQVLSHLRSRCDDRGATAIVATHDLRATSYAHRVVILRDGRVVDDVPANPRRSG